MSRLRRKFPKLDDWKEGTTYPTFRQLESFARATRTPVGYFFLAEPPAVDVPIPDLRTIGNQQRESPSPDLLDVVYLCQQRQQWYRDYARFMGESRLDFVGSAELSHAVESTATRIRSALQMDLAERRELGRWEDALRRFVEQAEAFGVLVMVSGIVGSNTHRKLDPEEFRGFALSDDLAPLVFINGADTKSAQMFTLAHELAHIWLGESALSDAAPVSSPENDVERWCDQVAAELLVPLSAVRDAYDHRASLQVEVRRLARRFKVSTLVVLRRVHDAGGIGPDELRSAYRAELDRLLSVARRPGGNFYNSTQARVSRPFAQAVVISAWEGRSSFTEAFHLLGCRKMTTFRELGHQVGIDL